MKPMRSRSTSSPSTSSTFENVRNLCIPILLGIFGLAFLTVLCVTTTMSKTANHLWFFVGISIFGIFSAVFMTWCVFRKERGTPEMNRVSAAISAGANGFFRQQYKAIAVGGVCVAAVLFTGYVFRQNKDFSRVAYAACMTGGFILGAICSGLAGAAGLWICLQTNIRVAAAAKRSYKECVQTALLAGSIPALFVVCMVVCGIVFLWGVFELSLGAHNKHIPGLLIGYAFGASFVALFAQLGGGIYTKAADVGADLVGKIEQDLEEDDPRNPAVIADLVGDNVGDCAGRGADLFESIAAEIIAAMILGTIMVRDPEIGHGYILFPLAVTVIGIIVSLIGIMSVFLLPDSWHANRNPMTVLRFGYIVATVFSIGGLYLCCWLLLDVKGFPSAYWRFFFCGLIGIIACVCILLITEYYTDYRYRPVRNIGAASVSGHATNIIAGIAMGLESCLMPVIVIVACILGSFKVGGSVPLKHADLYGTAVCTMGFLSTAVYILAMDFFGPIADNAGGIVEMANESAEVREITDALDAVGNTTKASTKGYAVVSAALACFLLLRAFMDEITLLAGGHINALNSVDITQPSIFLAGMLGACLVMVFTSLTIRAVGVTAEKLVVEVRRQFDTIPGLRDGLVEPDYEACVALVTKESLKQMILPGLLAILSPLAIGGFFRMVGYFSNDPLLSSQCICSMLLFSTVTGVLMALFLNNAGGAWDNAKKLVETGEFGGKGSEAHKAAVTGDTVGDPFKDTAGPSIHVLMKLLSTITLCAAPLFIKMT